jgi:hypothetical protein
MLIRKNDTPADEQHLEHVIVLLSKIKLHSCSYNSSRMVLFGGAN